MPTGDTVLVLTSPDDPTADAVITALAAHPVRVARIDTGDFPARMRLSATNVGKGWTGQLCTDHVTVELEQVRSVYYRRPTRFTFPAGMSEADRVYGAVEARMGPGRGALGVGLLVCEPSAHRSAGRVQTPAANRRRAGRIDDAGYPDR